MHTSSWFYMLLSTKRLPLTVSSSAAFQEMASSISSILCPFSIPRSEFYLLSKLPLLWSVSALYLVSAIRKVVCLCNLCFFLRGLFEIWFQIEEYYTDKGLGIVGYFHANERFDDLELSNVAKNIGDHISKYLPVAALLLVCTLNYISQHSDLKFLVPVEFLILLNVEGLKL